MHVAANVEELGAIRSAPAVKQHWPACVCCSIGSSPARSSFLIPHTPSGGPRHSVSKGATAVISSAEARELLDSMDASTVAGMRDRAMVAVMVFTFARVSAVVNLKVEDYYPQKKRRWLRLREKNGKVNEMPCHHKLEAYLDAYIGAAFIEGDSKGPLFRAAIGRTGKLSDRPMSRVDAKLETSIGCHTFRATGITDYLTNGGKLEIVQRMAGHANAKTTGAAMTSASAKLSAWGFDAW
jgi:integrase/recombinase XerD